MGRDIVYPPLKQVTRDEWLAHIQRFPDRHSYRTGIVEPPQEICEAEGRRIAIVSYPTLERPEYFIEAPVVDAEVEHG